MGDGAWSACTAGVAGAGVPWTAGVVADGGVEDAGRAAGSAGVGGATARCMAGLAADGGVDETPSSAGSAGAAPDAVRWTTGGVEAAEGDCGVLVEPERAGELGWLGVRLGPVGGGCEAAPEARSEGEPGCGGAALGLMTG